MEFVRVEGVVFFCLRLINWLLFGVFGVWVQLDRLAVNEDPARIRTFTPILVI